MPDTSHYRSGAVARMVGMPVTTLRVWERRYGVGSAEVAPSGHRLYSAADVERIALLKRLTQLGHAIGSIAPLGAAELRRVGATHAEARALAEDGGPAVAAPARRGATALTASGREAPPARVVVVGAALAQRLQRLTRADARWRVVGVFEDLAEAARAGGGRGGRGEHRGGVRRDGDGGRQRHGPGNHSPAPGPGSTGRADVLLIDLPALPAQVTRELAAARRAWPGARAGLVYGFGAEAARAEHAAGGLALLRDPRDDAALVGWVESLGCRSSAGGSGRARTGTRIGTGTGARNGAATPRTAWTLSPDELAREASALAFSLPLGLMDLAAEAGGRARGRHDSAGQPSRGPRSGRAAAATPSGPVTPGALPPRRFDDLTLVELAARSPAMACECPRHVAELLKQLSHFEAYSAQCRSRNRADAEVHAHLHRVAGLARALFERALERVALHEGLALPVVAPPSPP